MSKRKQKPTKPSKEQWITPLNIPSGVEGEYEVKQEVLPAGEKVMLGNMRTAFFGQEGKGEITYSHETTWHQLLHKRGRLMSDWPIEQKQISKSLTGMRGSVLVGGLGLGLAVAMLTKKLSVRRIVVVEIAPEVIKLVAKVVDSWKMEVVCSDLLEYVKGYNGKPFDHAFYDTWSSDGEGTFFHTVLPLWEASHGKVLHQPQCWNIDIMRAQLFQSIQSRLMFLDPEVRTKFGMTGMKELWKEDGTEEPWHNWSVPFFQWVKEEEPMEKELQQGMTLYCQIYGWKDWRGLWSKYTGI